MTDRRTSTHGPWRPGFVGARWPIVPGFVMALLLFGLSGKPVEAESCRPVMPDRASDATGSTFQARVTGIRLEGSGPAQTFYTMAVTKVYASGASDRLQAGRTIEVYSNPCDGFALLGIEAGDRILMSTAQLESADRPATWNTAVWGFEGARMRLLILDNGIVWRSSDQRIARARTIQAALALVVRGAPDTATASPKKAVDLSAVAFVASVVTVTLLILGARSGRSTGVTPLR